MRTNRSIGLDALRLFGFVGIVIGHSIESAAVRTAVYPWHVAIFFLLTGYLWTSGRSLKAEWIKRWNTLVVPSLAWLSVIGIPLLIVEFWTRDLDSVVRRGATFVLGGSFLKSPFEAYWFVGALAVSAVIYRLLDNSIGPSRAQVLAFVALPLTFTAGWLDAVPQSIGVGAMAVFFIAAGHFAQGHRFIAVGFWPIELALGALLVATSISEPLDMKTADWGTPVVSFATAVLLCLGLVGCFERVFRFSTRTWISSAASLGLVMVLVHGIPIYFLRGEMAGAKIAAISLIWSAAVTWMVRDVSLLTGRPRARAVGSSSA